MYALCIVYYTKKSSYTFYILVVFGAFVVLIVYLNKSLIYSNQHKSSKYYQHVNINIIIYSLYKFFKNHLYIYFLYYYNEISGVNVL